MWPGAAEAPQLAAKMPEGEADERSNFRRESPGRSDGKVAPPASVVLVFIHIGLTSDAVHLR